MMPVRQTKEHIAMRSVIPLVRKDLVFEHAIAHPTEGTYIHTIPNSGHALGKEQDMLTTLKTSVVAGSMMVGTVYVMVADASDCNIPYEQSANVASACFEGEIPYEHVSSASATVILGDSLKVMKSMKSESVDLIFVDPPYNIGKDFGNNKDKWDDVDSYIEWCKEWIDDCMRILKPDGTMYFMTATQHMPYLDVYVSRKYHVLSRIVWAYDSSGVQSKKIYGSLYEPILMVAKTGKAKFTFNASAIMVEAKTGAQRKLIDYRKDPPQPYGSEKVPGNVWQFPRVRFRMDEYENHPTQKPETLLERIVLASSNEGDIVFDPFAGSFTTCAVASRLGRRTIGIELNRDYFEIGLRRTGLAKEYNGKILAKERVKKSGAKSKNVR